MEVRPLHEVFAAELIGADLAQDPDAALVQTVEEAMTRYAVVVVRDQTHVGDDEHIRFSRAFGPLELPPSLGFKTSGNRRFRWELYDASNLDVDGNIEAADTLKRRYSKGNEQFHTDSSFNDLPTKWSLLFCHIATPERGETEFVDTRAAYDRLSDAMKSRVDGLIVEHNVWRSRERAGFTDTDPLKKALPAVRHPLVRESASGRKALYIGSHADHIVDMPLDEGRALLDELTAIATEAKFVYAHKWRNGDLVIWDNRCTLHRATEFDYLSHKRDLRRTTINEYGEERAANEGLRATAA
ncbi:TauD/TfdA family dioxygenase [Sphingosinicella sp. CPCC 101087]|uniref:TauD/TfdA dioxygenase family protein n=1 Tax=Sphingosinicella sp. CPCC 101087 TaxID=2497754 RepID=UPI00101C45CF|nr:TauD/TfdA family dioxygenase [Sphingosinicella sp. CPCC 101087]